MCSAICSRGHILLLCRCIHGPVARSSTLFTRIGFYAKPERSSLFVNTRCAGTLLTTCASANPWEFPDNHSVEPEAGVEENKCGPGNDGYDAEKNLVGERVLEMGSKKYRYTREIRRTKSRTAQLSNWVSCGGRIEYHAILLNLCCLADGRGACWS